MMKSNKKTGTDFEQEVCRILALRGYWVHNFANRKNGQPADIIAIKDGVACLIDAKVCSSGTFKTSRIEENQILSMKRWFACGNRAVMFWLQLPDKTISCIMLENEQELDALLQRKTLREDMIRAMGIGWTNGKGGIENE